MKNIKNVKKRVLSLFLTLAIFVSGFGFFEPVQATGIVNILEYDSNSNAKEFIITSAQGLMKFSSLASKTNFDGKTLYLGNDINMSGYEYTPFTSFSGTLNGNYFSVKDLGITTFNVNTGLVGTLEPKGVIKNLGIEGGTINARVSTDSQRVGSFAGVNNGGLVECCWSTSTVKGAKLNDSSTTDISVGGIVGGSLNGGIVRSCYFAGHLVGIDHVSGISDWCQGHYSGYVGRIENCYEAGTYSATEVFSLGRYATGILEENKASAIVNSYYSKGNQAYTWAGMLPYTKGDLESGILAYKLDGNGASDRTRIWRQGAHFPEIAPDREGGVYKLTMKVRALGGTSTSQFVYMNAGEKYTAQAGADADFNLTSAFGAVSGNTYTMSATNSLLNVEVNLPNVLDIASYSSYNSFVVTNYEGFQALASFVNGGKGTLSGKTIYMLHDINMESRLHTPVGTFVSEDDWSKSFSGKFVGNDFRIINIKVENTGLNGAGLFGSSRNATFEHVGIAGGSVVSNNRAGGLTGYGDTCKFVACYNSADITTKGGTDGCGGIAGVSRLNSEFYYCYNLGNITAETEAAGGISGWGQGNVKAYGCFNAGNVYSPSSHTALIRTKAEYTTAFASCYYLENVASSNGGTKKSFAAMCNENSGYNLNTLGGTRENAMVYTNTPRFPAIKTENDSYATKAKITAKSKSTGETFSSVTVYGNNGDKVAVNESENGSFYATTPAVLGTTFSLEVYEPFYTVSFVTNGGTINETAIDGYYSSVSTSLPCNVTKNGYVFMGWYEDSAMTSKPAVYVSKGDVGNKTYYAKWGNEYLISSPADFVSFATKVNNGTLISSAYVKLTCDIDLSSVACSAVGTSSKPFGGVFDGNGYTISGYDLNTSDNNVGLFGYVKGGIVKNVFLESGNVKGKSNVGSIVGNNEGGVVYNCGSDGTVTSTLTKANVSIMSFNIRVPSDPSPNSLNDRVPRVRTYLKNYSPDIVGMQEVTDAWKPHLDSILSGYSSEFVYRAAVNSEAAPLYWKTSKFDCLEKGTFWLSETPGVESIGWDAGYYRTCSYAVLKEKISGRIILAYNTHLDVSGAVARKRGAELIIRHMKENEAEYAAKGYEYISGFLTGDYNTKPNSDPYIVLSEYMSDSSTVADKLLSPADTKTFNGFTNAVGTSTIDFVFLDDCDMDVLTYKVTNENSYGGYVSDHYGIFVETSLTNKASGGIVGRNNGDVINCYFTGRVNGAFCSGGLVGDNIGAIVGGYSSGAVSGGDELGAITAINRGEVDKSYYVSSLAGAYNESCGNSTTEATLKGNSTILGKYGTWKNVENVNGGYPIPAVMRCGIEFETKLILTENSTYSLENGIVMGIKANQSKEETFANFKNPVLDAPNGIVTGGKINLIVGGEITDSATIVILGDLDGNGTLDNTDYMRLKNAFLDKFELEGAYLIAADTDKDGELSSSDYLRIKSHFLGTFDLYN